MPLALQGFLQTKKQQCIKDYDHRARVVELRPGDKVLVKLDAYHGAHCKLIYWWSSNLHTVVRHIADDVPGYVIENDNGKQKGNPPGATSAEVVL